MKTIDIARRYGFDIDDFDNFLIEQGVDYTTGLMGGLTIPDNIAIEYTQLYKKHLENKQVITDEKQQADNEKQEAVSNMLITSGFNFDGYRIKKYSGYISGDAVISIERGAEGLFSEATDVAGSLANSLVAIRRQAIQELKEQAYDLGCNAVIGIDYDYITLEPETRISGTINTTEYLPYVFCVTANGNAVIIEKEDDDNN